jgi:hypothetical protein
LPASFVKSANFMLRGLCVMRILWGIVGLIEGWRRLMVLSLDCRGCSQMRFCRIRFCRVTVGETVSCPDGTVHLVDGGS